MPNLNDTTSELYMCGNVSIQILTAKLKKYKKKRKQTPQLKEVIGNLTKTIKRHEANQVARNKEVARKYKQYKARAKLLQDLKSKRIS